MTNSIDGQILSWELQAPGQFVKVDSAKLRDVAWDRKCTIYSYDTMGIWNNDVMVETDINCVSVSADGRYLATGDALGPPKVFMYPAHLPGQAYQQLDSGHISQVISVKFTPDDMFLITVSENDSTILIWAYKAFGLNKEPQPYHPSQNLQIQVPTPKGPQQNMMAGLLN